MNIYLDNAATTRLDPRVLSAMRPYLDGAKYANASSIHQPGQIAYLELEDARRRVAKVLGGDERGIIFTSGATESNNLIIKGFALANQEKRRKVIVSNIEHPSVREAANELARAGFQVEFVPADKDGLVQPEALEAIIDDKTSLVSIMAVNNEIGTINDIEALARVAHKHGAYFHVDAVQAVPYLRLDIKKSNLDFLSLSAHKFNGPKGVGVAYIRPGLKVKPLLVGGGQENNMRSGTTNLAGIIGLTVALELAYKERSAYLKKMKDLSRQLLSGIQAAVPAVYLNGSKTHRVPANLNLRFTSIEGEAILMDLSQRGVFVSTGSACSASNLRASSVLKAIGLDKNYLNSNIRFSLGRFNTAAEIEYTIKAVKASVERLRRFSPIKSDGTPKGKPRGK
jgi:cysteine desulfurase